jgi:hypothetical protein
MPMRGTGKPFFVHCLRIRDPHNFRSEQLVLLGFTKTAKGKKQDT